jgi:vancomycin resistance protein VanW
MSFYEEVTMARKRLTEAFPWLLPLRQYQRKLFFYTGMRLSRNIYTRTQQKKLLPYEIFKSRAMMINTHSGYDIQYQYNKVHNLKLAAAKVDGIVIKPGECFSLCYAIKDADKDEPYLEGLSLSNGKTTGEYGGGLCQLSNLLYWVFLHTPLTVTERHGHGTESIPPADPNELAGIDATIAEGWLDLKVKNDTCHAFQISVTFEGDDIIGAVRSESEKCYDYKVYNTSCDYIRKGGVLYQEADVARKKRSCFTGCESEEILYHNHCVIGYPLPQHIEIKEGV